MAPPVLPRGGSSVRLASRSIARSAASRPVAPVQFPRPGPLALKSALIAAGLALAAASLATLVLSRNRTVKKHTDTRRVRNASVAKITLARFLAGRKHYLDVQMRTSYDAFISACL